MNFVSRSLRVGSALKNLASSSSSTSALAAAAATASASSATRATLVLPQNVLLRFLATQAASHDAIEKLVKHNKIVVFMKGVPAEPRCGFSNAVVKILEMHGVQDYDAHDVLADESLRQGIKEYSNWPTVPQVFLDGEFVGGCDIVMEMHKNGELVDLLKKAGIKSALLEADEHKPKQ